VLLGDRGSGWRCLLVWASGTATLGTVALLLGPCAGRLDVTPAALGALPLDLALVDVSACVVLGCALWAWLALTAAVLDAWRGVGTTRRRPWHLPDGVRRLVLTACGVALASGVTAPAEATDGGPGRHPSGAALLSGLPLPDRAVAPSAAPRRRTPSSSTTRFVVVRPGDSLWSIAAAALPASASDQRIDARWRAIYAANRRVVGPDPDVIEAGQHLHLPTQHSPRKDRP
jgi:LysM domain-containing protein